MHCVADNQFDGDYDIETLISDELIDYTTLISGVLENNKSLESFCSNIPLSPDNILTCLGHHCQLLSKLELKEFRDDDMFHSDCFEVFSTGCRRLKCLTLVQCPHDHCNNFFRCLLVGTYNPLLEKLVVLRDRNVEQSTLDVLETQSLELFYKGCPACSFIVSTSL